MEDALGRSLQSPAPAPVAPAHRSTISPFYYSLLGIASIAVILLAYNIVVVGWCWQHHRSRQRLRQSNHAFLSMPKSVEGIPMYKYRKEETLVQASQSECSVCLSVFVEGEDIRKLPKCKHQFHADCIDMWLYSHSNCPVCRTVVVVPQALRGGNAVDMGSSREALMNFGNVV
ncbi:RING-H2 finger protein ATL52-like [Aristolochia californica]|uniref:RING-H2 finger protein ATL52-like n=1 Tax=Aristolochia californica TaxID=171875 RepID=UPI0035E11DAF